MKKKRLRVSTETIKVLLSADLTQVAGGNIKTRTGCTTAFTCPSDIGCN